jgi:cell division septum initiation protein DivIVA
MKLLLEERFERIALLETRIDTLDQLVEGFRAREQSIFNTLQATKANAANALEEAKAEGAKIIAEAEAVRAEAEKIRNDARMEAEALLSQAITTANTLKEEAERRGNELTANIRADSERMLKDALIIKREYEEMVETFNGILEQNASELEVTATRFAEFVKNRRIDRSEARLDGDAFYKSVGEMNDTTLPDASENPSLLMRNIYRIQNRPLPEDRQETPAPAQEKAAPATQPATTEQKTVYSMEVGADATEADTANKPFSEQAWANDALKSESEPQAEFVRPFDPDYAPSDYTIHHDACLVTQEDAESAFDALVPDAGVNASVALPLGSAAVASGMGEKPMEETVREVDEYFESAIEPDAKAAQDTESAAVPEPYSEQAWAQSETLSELEPQAEGTLFTHVNEIAQEAAQTPIQEAPAEEPTAAEAEAPAMPEPYSEQAWEQSETRSELEPQAEGTLFTHVNEIAQEAAQTPTPDAPAEAAYTPAQPIPTVEKPVSSADMASALDDYFDEIDVSAPTLPQTPTTRLNGSPDPYSENAWEQTNLASDVEPQAEGQLFADLNAMLPDFVPASAELAGQFVPTAFGVVEVKQPVTSNEAEHAFDAYLNKMDAVEPAAAPDPYSEQAWQQNDFASEHEAQAEGGLFNDVNAYEPAFTPAAGAPVAPVRVAAEPEPVRGPVTATDAVNVFDSYLEQMEPFAPTVPQAPEEAPAAAPEPYSAEAWAYTPNVSEYEPQAEGDSIISATLDETLGVPEAAPEPFSYIAAACTTEPEEEEEPEPAPAPRKYNEYGEIREWEPEPEPDMGDIPTVSRFMGASGSDEVSLDDLLDEIIKAGE